MRLSLKVYVITADVPELGRSHEDVAAAAISGGADVIQFREKNLPDQQFEAVARRLLALCRAQNVPLIINDRVEIAAKIGADGVHVGHEDFVADESHNCQLRQMWGTSGKVTIGLSARNYDEAVLLAKTNPDYLGVGPIFPTPSKDDASPPIGCDELRRICHAVALPVVAIGGITTANLPQMIETGAAGAAVISAVAHAPDMQRAVQELTSAWQRSRQPS